MARIAVIGAGYVGLTTSICLASLGHQVSVYDVNKDRLQSLAAGQLPIYEPGLEELLFRVRNNYYVSNSLHDCLHDAVFVFVCVPTPQSPSGATDTSFVIEATMDCLEIMMSGSTLVLKSTMPVGTADKLAAENPRSDVEICSNPEFLREGTAIKDFMNPDRVVVGAENKEGAQKVADLYEDLETEYILTSRNSAELIKYASNAMLASRISFINEIAAFAQAVNIDVREIALGLGMDKRIGASFLNAGPGWGGSCFPKDTNSLIYQAETLGIETPLISGIWNSNVRTIDRIVETLNQMLPEGLQDAKIGVLGIAFKANTDDTRDSPALAIITRLLGAGARVKAFDPLAQLPENSPVEPAELGAEVFVDADAVIVATEWPEFDDLARAGALSRMKQKNIFDTRGVLTSPEWFSKDVNLRVWGVGQ